MANQSLSPEQRARVARAVLKNNIQLRSGERVVIEAWTHTLPWAVTFAREARRLGATPVVPYEDEDAYWDAVDEGEDRVLGTVGAHEWALLGKTDVYLHMWGPGDRVRLNALPQARRGRLFGFNEAWYAAAQKAGLRGARLELGRPYPSLAKAYHVDESEWLDQVLKSTLVDPVALARRGAPITKALAKGKKVRIRDDRGTDLTLGLIKKPVRGEYGRSTPAERKKPFSSLFFLPAGSIRAPLDVAVADGTIVGNRTDYYDDAIATGGTLHFAHGKLTEATFEHGGERFDKEFKKGGKGRDRPGQLGIGLNPALHDTPQMEDRELGAVMVSVGNNQFQGGTNKSPFFGFVVNVGATVEVDGVPLPLGR
ncbi:MAG TPA: aminopeptidase [Thermoplasmata archaeon]|nr:aminopeptidase [Thermoplasmata archaeon]